MSKPKRSLEDGYDMYNPAPFIENNPSFKYYTDNINPIYVDNNTGEVWQNNKPKGSIILPDVEVKGKSLKFKEQLEKLPHEKGLETPMIDPFLLVLGAGKYSGDIIGDIAGELIGNGINKIIFPGMRNPKSIVQSIKAITKANASKITPAQWTIAQDAAIARGDMSEAQRLRDLHFKVNAHNTKIVDDSGNPLKVYHGTKNKFNTFDESLYGSTDGGMYGTGVYTTPYKEYAERYGDNIMNLYANIKYPVDARNLSIEDLMIGKLEEGNNIFRWHDIGGVRDGVLGKNHYLNTKYPYEIVSHKPNNMKLADAITYDDKGVRIPLGERDNFNSNDIRYALMPFIIGVTGYGIYNRVKKRNGGSIHIVPSKRGTFTAAATKHGMGVQDFASKVLRNKDSYSPAMVKKANFARNASKWNH